MPATHAGNGQCGMGQVIAGIYAERYCGYSLLKHARCLIQ